LKKGEAKQKMNNLGLITGLFDINNDGRLDIAEEALLISERSWKTHWQAMALFRHMNTNITV